MQEPLHHDDQYELGLGWLTAPESASLVRSPLATPEDDATARDGCQVATVPLPLSFASCGDDRPRLIPVALNTTSGCREPIGRPNWAAAARQPRRVQRAGRPATTRRAASGGPAELAVPCVDPLDQIALGFWLSAAHWWEVESWLQVQVFQAVCWCRNA